MYLPVWEDALTRTGGQLRSPRSRTTWRLGCCPCQVPSIGCCCARRDSLARQPQAYTYTRYGGIWDKVAGSCANQGVVPWTLGLSLTLSLGVLRSDAVLV